MGKAQINFETKTGDTRLALRDKSRRVCAIERKPRKTNFNRTAHHEVAALATPQVVRRYRENKVFAVREPRSGGFSHGEMRQIARASGRIKC